MATLIPNILWLRDYKREWLSLDIFAGLATALHIGHS